jgi:hypothetical protein
MTPDADFRPQSERPAFGIFAAIVIELGALAAWAVRVVGF